MFEKVLITDEEMPVGVTVPVGQVGIARIVPVEQVEPDR